MFTIWLASFPFILLYGAYEGPKVFWLWIGGFFLTLSWIIRSVKSEPIYTTEESRWLICWIAVLGVASLFGIHPLDSFIGGSYRHQGVLFFFVVCLIAETVRRVSPKQKQFLYVLLAGGVVVESILVLIQKYVHGSSRPLGTFGEPNAVAGYLAIGLAWIIWAPIVRSRYRIFTYLLVCIAIVATASRTGIASAIVVTVGLAIATIVKHKKKWLQTGSILVGCFILAIGSLFLIQSITHARPTSIYEDRGLFWRLGVQAFIQRPLLGYGAESGEVIYNGAFQSINVRLVDFMVDRSHNLFLDIALWSGAIGLFVFVGWLVISVRTLIKKRNFLRVFVFGAWVLFASFQPLGVAHWIQLVLLLYVM